MNDDRVIIFDTTLRDGEQSPGISLNTSEKLEIAHQLARLGVDVIEAGFPIASPGDFEAVQAIARQVEGPIIAGLARVHVGDIDAAYGAVRDAERPRIHTFVSTSDIHIEHQLASTREDVKGQARAAVAHARSLVDDVEFSPMDATRADVEYTAEVVQIAIDEGATTINIPDTVGYTMPDEYQAFLGRLYELAPGLRDVVLSVHCHDDLGLAVANSFAGLQAGARQVECAINGIGERAGNASLEEIVMLLHTRAAHVGGLHTGINTREIARTSPPDLAPHRLPGAAEQGDRGAQRVRPRVRHPPGRRAQGAHDLRDHGRDDRRARRQLAGAGQALRPPRAQERAGGAGLRGLRPGAEHRVQALQGDRGQEEAGHRDGPRGAGHRRAPRPGARLHARVVRRRGLDPPPAARDRAAADARRRGGARRLHRRRPGRRDLPRHQRRDQARVPLARVPHRLGDRRPGRARRGERRARARRPVGGRPGRLDRHHRGGRARLRARALERRAARARGGRDPAPEAAEAELTATP